MFVRYSHSRDDAQWCVICLCIEWARIVCCRVHLRPSEPSAQFACPTCAHKKAMLSSSRSVQRPVVTSSGSTLRTAYRSHEKETRTRLRMIINIIRRISRAHCTNKHSNERRTCRNVREHSCIMPAAKWIIFHVHEIVNGVMENRTTEISAMAFLRASGSIRGLS